MQKMKRTFVAVVIAGAVAGGGYGFFASPMTPTAQAHLKDHPRLEGAYNSLREAKEYLETSPSDFHGHKKDAIHAINEAIQQVSLSVESAEKKAAPAAPTAAPREHEKLHVCREKLADAKAYMQEAHAADFGGHKEGAIKAIDEAIHQIDLCLGA